MQAVGEIMGRVVIITYFVPALQMIFAGVRINNFRNEIALFPDADVGICVLMNNTTSFAKRVIPDLYAIVKEIYGTSASLAGPENHLVAQARH
mgnify:CR=1 FL=1